MSAHKTFKDLLPGRPVVFSDAELASEFGGTHLAVSELPFRYDAFLPDNSDPYPAWSQSAISLFRVFPPPALEKWIPAETVRSNRRHIDGLYADACRRGLDFAVSGHEPMWLPEGVYREHPHWRGSQCELGRIAGKPYFTPSIDEPEVQELYRHAAREWCRAYPRTASFSFWTNDCGSGIPWTTYAYPGPNGPAKYRGRNPGERMADWLNAIREGACDAGCDVTVHIHSFSFPPAETAAIRARLGDKLFLNGINGEGKTLSGASASCAGDAAAWPVAGICHPVKFVKGLQEMLQAQGGTGVLSVACDPDTKEMARLLLAAFMESPGTDCINQFKVLRRVAAMLAGENNAEALISVWQSVEQACHAVRQIRQRGLGLAVPFCLTTARWLTRPLVPKPLELTDAESSSYKKFLFSTGTDEQNANLCYVLGKPVFHGDGVVWMTRWCLHEAIGILRTARNKLAPIIAAAGKGAAIDALLLYDARLGAFACALETARCAVLYQHALGIADQPRFAANPLDFDDNIQFDQRALEMRKIARSELDNTQELIDLIDANAGNRLFDCADSPETESVFKLGPNLVEDLRRKREVMLDHWHDYERLYPTSKVWEFEPATPSEPR